jgi:hypothetical protein
MASQTERITSTDPVGTVYTMALVLPDRLPWAMDME